MFVAAQARLESSMHEGADARKSLQLGVNDLRACLDSAPQTDKGYVRAKLQSGVNQLVPCHCRPLITICGHPPAEHTVVLSLKNG